MTIDFLSQDIWSQLTKAVRASKQRCAVAVAYFGAGAGRLLPLPKGSRLVVDASDRAVATGQTCPTDLLDLMKRGVSVYSIPNLHAKVFVVGRVAYIGSTNVSNRSATQLVEAAIRTTDSGAVRSAREFVNDHCLHELTPELLKQLVQLYRPPLIPGGKRSKARVKETSQRPTLPRLFMVQLRPEPWSDDLQRILDDGLLAAKTRRQHPRKFELDSFHWYGKCPYVPGDKVVQVTDEGNGSVLVTPPGNVLHVQSGRDGNKQVSIVFVELPARRRRQVKALARTLACEPNRLLRNGLIRDQLFAQALLKAWAVTS